MTIVNNIGIFYPYRRSLSTRKHQSHKTPFLFCLLLYYTFLYSILQSGNVHTSTLHKAKGQSRSGKHFELASHHPMQPMEPMEPISRSNNETSSNSFEDLHNRYTWYFLYWVLASTHGGTRHPVSGLTQRLITHRLHDFILASRRLSLLLVLLYEYWSCTSTVLYWVLQ